MRYEFVDTTTGEWYTWKQDSMWMSYYDWSVRCSRSSLSSSISRLRALARSGVEAHYSGCAAMEEIRSRRQDPEGAANTSRALAHPVILILERRDAADQSGALP